MNEYLIKVKARRPGFIFDDYMEGSFVVNAKNAKEAEKVAEEEIKEKARYNADKVNIIDIKKI